MPKAYVLHSGGIDSSTCLYHAADTFNGQVCAVSFEYGQPHSKEIEYAKLIARDVNAAHMVKDLTNIMGKGGLTDNQLVMPNVDYSDLPEGVSPTFVPFRNGLLLSAITGIAVTDPEAEAIYFGAHADDAANWAYPDCTPEFIGAMANAIYVGSYHKLRLYTPLSFLDKAGVIRLGNTLGVHWYNTWSCYKGEEIHCGICPTCRSRRTGFIEADVWDPTSYKEIAA